MVSDEHHLYKKAQWLGNKCSFFCASLAPALMADLAEVVPDKSDECNGSLQFDKG